jgi:hypothetical protein
MNALLSIFHLLPVILGSLIEVNGCDFRNLHTELFVDRKTVVQHRRRQFTEMLKPARANY